MAGKQVAAGGVGPSQGLLYFCHTVIAIFCGALHVVAVYRFIAVGRIQEFIVKCFGVAHLMLGSRLSALGSRLSTQATQVCSVLL